ncbi:MAG: hypothetical protein R3258_01755 [Acidimicrobiia bacterium]|nr:hypothetical protein [Acidimicrobiia bacterium]
MTSRTTGALLAFVLSLGACNGAAGEESTTTTTPPPPPTTAAASEAVLLAYSLEAGTTLTYDIEFEIDLEMVVTGDAASLTEGEELPGVLDVTMSGETTLVYEIKEGPEAGTFEITITGDLTAFEVTGTADGEPVEEETLPELVEMDPLEVNVVVDEQGRVVDDFDPGVGLMSGSIGAFLPGQGSDLARFVGPPMSDSEVKVGSTWSETVETQLFLGDPIVTTIESEVTDITGDGIFLIETTTVVSETSFDMGTLLIEMFEAFIPEEASEEELAELESLKEELRLLFSFDEATDVMTTRFDPRLGLAIEATSEGATHLSMDVNMPDETTGEMVAFSLEMDAFQTVGYRLVDPPG